MTAQLIDGKLIAQQVRDEVAAKVAERVAAGKSKPTLATVLVGERMDSATYVASKQKACAELGMGSVSHNLPSDISQEDLEKLIKSLNDDKSVHGILVQLPLPAHLNEERLLQLVSIEKDVDGFSPINIGRLAQKGREPLFVPCTPYGCIYLFEKAGVKIESANAVVLGRSNIVGMPAALLLISRNATVTVCHSRTRDLPNVVRQADILIAVMGRPRAITADMVRDGAVVIDVGVNAIPDATRKKGTRLVGDVDYDAVAVKAAAITPVPGGVGPMTRAMLLYNTVLAASGGPAAAG